ncbi:MAG: PAS-domain containing protein [Alphaproteobacteria bacterium]|nr:PAS-domain containing protein [Alphaproteobacteria bacterium]
MARAAMEPGDGDRQLAEAEARLHVALDNMPGALVYTDDDLNIVICNERLKAMYPVPRELLQPGRPYPAFLRHLAENGYYGPGDVDALVARRVESLRNPSGETFEDRQPDGRIYRIRRRRVDAGGVVTVMTDVTAQKQAEAELAAREAQFHVALNNLPGAVVYTDDKLDIVICNDRFRDMYRVPPELLQPGRPYPAFLRYLAENGYYGSGDVEALVARRVESLRNPTGQVFEDHPPDGRIYSVRRRRVDAGGVVTVMVDITDQTKAEKELAAREAEFHVALDNMPGALVYTDDDLNIVICNERFREMYRAPRDLLQAGRPYPAFLRYLAENGYYGAGDVAALVARRVASLRNPSGETFEDHTPDGRVYAVRRRRVDAGGVVTVMTDITDQKRAELALLEAKRRTEEANALVSEKNEMLEALSSKLSKYLSPQLYRSIFSGQQNVEIASKRKKLTVFFSDIAAFTETTENLESEDLTDVLNHYLTEMSRIALAHGATIDKYIGDAMLLFFGDPESRGVKEDAKACVLMALAMQRRMRELEQEWRNRGLERPFRIRMGISTGFCTVGNFGSQDRMDYTIIGNEVNLAARLESAAEPGSILLAHETNALVSDLVLTEEQPPITAKGFLRPINTYKVVGAYNELVETGRIVLQERDGLRVLVDLTKQDKSAAISILEEVLLQLKG